MRRRELASAAVALLAGCVTVETDVSDGATDDGEGTGGGEDTTTEQPTIEAGGGSAAGLGGGDLPIAREQVLAEINARREDIDGAPAVATEGSHADRLQQYAQDHTDVMHDMGRVAINMEESELLDDIEESNCSVPRDDTDFNWYGEDIVIVDSIDTIGRAPAELADQLVSRWLDDEQRRPVLLADEAGYMQSGVALRGTTLLLTVIFC